MKALSADSILARLLGKLTAAVFRHPRWFVYPAGGAVRGLRALHRRLPEGGHEPGQPGRPQPEVSPEFSPVARRSFPQQGNDLVVVVESEDPEKNRQFVERLAMKMAPETNLFLDVFYQHDLEMMGTKALFFVPEDGSGGHSSKRCTTIMPFIRQFTQTTNLVSFFNQINTAFRTAPRETNAQTESLVQALPVLTRILTQANASLQMSGKPPSPGVAALFGADDVRTSTSPSIMAGFFCSRRSAPSDDLNGEAIERLRQLVEQTQDEVPGLNVGLTGEPVLDYDQMTQSQKDITLASIVSLVLCALIFIYGYNETGRPIKATICLVIGLAYTLGSPR